MHIKSLLVDINIYINMNIFLDCNSRYTESLKLAIDESFHPQMTPIGKWRQHLWSLLVGLGYKLS